MHRSAVIIFIVALSACGRPEAKAEAPVSPCHEKRFEGSRFTVCDPKNASLVLIAARKNERPLRSFTDVASKVDASRVAFAMNAGMFDEEGRPIGLAIVDGREVRAANRREGGGNFHLMPNGVFQVGRDGRAAVIATTAWKSSADVKVASQSGPMVVIGGKLHPKLDHDGTSRLIRNGVGARGGEALFVISEDGVSLGKFARFFPRRAEDAGCALFRWVGQLAVGPRQRPPRFASALGPDHRRA